MIRPITSLLNDAVTAMPVGRRVPFAEVIDGAPSTHAGNGQFVPVINDNQGGVSYWRANGKSSVETMRGTACGDAVRVSIPLALVAFVRRDQCDDLQGILSIAANQLRASMRPLRDSIKGAFGASVSGIQLGVDLARTDEIKDFAVPASLAVLTLSCVLHIDASDACLDPCGTPYDLLCALIASASNARIVDCLGPDRVEQICEGGGPCAPFTITINGPGNVFADVDDPCGESLNIPVSNTEGDLVGSKVDGSWQIGNATVLRDGVPYGSVEAEGSIDVPSDCEPCPPTTVNGEESETPTITVLQGGVEVGTLNPATGVHTVPECEPESVRIRNANDSATLADVEAPGDYIIPAIQVPYIDANGDQQYFLGYVDGITGGELTLVQPGGGFPPVPRFTIFESDGTTPHDYRDIAGPSFTLPPTVLRLQFAQYSNEVQFDFDAASAGTYGTPTDDGSSGTITWSINGGAFGAWPGDTAFANGDYVSARRTTTSAIGWAQVTQ